jgi:hypothetical protein
MVVAILNPCVANEGFIGNVLAAAVAEASGRDVGFAMVGNDGDATRFFVGSRATAERARAMVAQGRSYADVLGALQGVPS